MTLEIETARRRSDSKIFFRHFVSNVDTSNVYDLFETWKEITTSKYEMKMWMDLRGLKLGKTLLRDKGCVVFHLEENDDKQ